ncbi:MAG: hypothetical protein K0S11_713 [Gammaproteobacteria bacterium]|jgi:uncharacterized Rmd1/YagE family protein|nr:hypothetical protein [Gammaproteobacteria bacterium]
MSNAMRCVSFCAATHYDLQAVAIYFKKQSYLTHFYRDVLHISDPASKIDLFFFNQGCFVSWGLKKRNEQNLIKELKQFSVDPLEKIETDLFVYRYGPETMMTSHEKLNMDMITLDSDNIQLKLAISYGLAQSIKLEYYEALIQHTIQNNSHIPRELAQHGKIKMSRTAISKRIGEIFIQRSYVNLNSEFLEVPEYFWRFPSMETYYVMVSEFLEIPHRVESLNKKLDTLYEVFGVLTNQLQHKHSSLLEWIIILLILLEILLSLTYHLL